MFKDIAVYSGNVLLLINAIIYLKSYRKVNSIAFKVFSIYILTILIIQFLSTIYFELLIENIHLSHYYFILQFILLSIVFRILINKRFFKRLIELYLVCIVIYLSIYYVLNPESYYSFNVTEILLTSIPLVVYNLVFFVQKIDDPNKEFLFSFSGLFIYMLCSILLFSASKVNVSKEVKGIIWYTNLILFIAYQSLILFEWYKNFRKKEIIAS